VSAASRSAVHVVGIAAGAGIDFILPMARALLESNDSACFTLLYGNRELASVRFAEELLALKNRFMSRFALHIFVSRETQEFELYDGRIDAAKIARVSPGLFEARRVDQFYICGPGSMAREVGSALHELGVEAKKIHSERFALDQAAPPPAVHVAAATEASTLVTIRMDGRSKQFEMPRNGAMSVLDAAGQAGIELPFSCKAGVCSTCRTHLSSGQVEMRHNYALEESELADGFILACQSVPTTDRIELDYDAR
jgi:ring-1,2-phenylacetyl-CoA epoxidase subunit PaaE